MENGHNTANGLQLTPLDQREHGGSSHDIVARRMKNRERQRRYRARKRQEADLKKVPDVSRSTHPQVEPQVNLKPNDNVSRIRCQRDWKKDARRVHTSSLSHPAIPNSKSASGSQPPPSLPSGPQALGQLPAESHPRALVVSTTEAPLSTPSGRNWKAEARKRKTDVATN